MGALTAPPRLSCSHADWLLPLPPLLKDAEGFGHRGLLAGGRCGYGLKCYRDQLDRSSLVGGQWRWQWAVVAVAERGIE